MSYTYLRDAGEESSAEFFSDIDPCVLSRLLSTADDHCSNGSGTDGCHDSQSGTTCEHSTAGHGEDLSTLSPVGSRVRISASTETGLASTENDPDCGRRCIGSLARYDRDSRSWRTRQRSLAGGFIEFSETWPRWGTMQNGECFRRPASAVSMYEKGYSYLPTPTAHNAKEGNYPAEHERRTPLLATHAGGKINPEWTEHLMRWPIGWSDLQPLATVRFQQWLSLHGGRSWNVS